ncbi:hypothetical protein BS47DRAFT_1489782 [Hydnum rufescens UP504]|uniref:protein-tyrosine-phosphatase n=1 Tax=Hydnum rufescens UP504 TaxID=1448309 RepID=A0A9P6AGY5_9AGAM|nr:hypothetical protein BS47DRAFT_1489782 [Hydnum rufescens UP504]
MLVPQHSLMGRCRLLRLRTSELNRGPLNERSLLGRKAWSLNSEDSSCNQPLLPAIADYSAASSETKSASTSSSGGPTSCSCGSFSIGHRAILIPVPKPLTSAPPTRRAFSGVMSRPSPISAGPDDDDDDERSSDFEVDTNSPAHTAQAARRENIGRLGNFTRPNSRIDPTKLDGKILPCHKVQEDGLMCITSDTLHDLVDGVYDALIENYMIIDCRFEYEHNGGHIPGSVNLNTNDAIEEHLLSSDKPMASRSGDDMRKTILIFHEFRVTRTPTLSVPFPPSIDVLIDSMELASITQRFTSWKADILSTTVVTLNTASPNWYVRMDDPAYQRAGATDLNDFRRWNRARSFTYGEQRTGSSVTSQEAPTEGIRPVSTDTGAKGKVGLSFAAAKAAFGRRGGERASNGVSGGSSTLQEDGDSSCANETDVSDSPCPPWNRTSLTIMGVTRCHETEGNATCDDHCPQQHQTLTICSRCLPFFTILSLREEPSNHRSEMRGPTLLGREQQGADIPHCFPMPCIPITFSYSSLTLSGLTSRFTPGLPLAFPIDDWHMLSKSVMRMPKLLNASSGPLAPVFSATLGHSSYLDSDRLVSLVFVDICQVFG